MRVMLDTNVFISMIFFPSARTRELAKRLTDAKDSPILATAILEDIDIFITGDKDFLVLEIETPKIVTMADFLDETIV